MYIKIKVVPGSKNESFEKTGEDSYNISVREPAKNNLANKRVIELVREHLASGKGEVKIVSGHHSPSKIISIN